ncbi:hypothetical protein LAZ67_4000690, partial [Cordylochernes scorpioides]
MFLELTYNDCVFRTIDPGESLKDQESTKETISIHRIDDDGFDEIELEEEEKGDQCKIDIPEEDLEDDDGIYDWKLPNRSPDDEDEEKIRFDQPYGWLVVFAGFISNMVVDGIGFSFGLFLNHLSQEFMVSKSSVAWIGSIIAGMILIAGMLYNQSFALPGPIAALMIARFSARKITIFGGILGALALMISSMAPHISMLFIVTSIIGGFGLGAIFFPASIIIGQYFKKRLATAAGIISCGSSAGSIVLPFLINWVLDNYGWRITFLTLGATILICAICGIAFRPNQSRIGLLKRIRQSRDENLNKFDSDEDEMVELHNLESSTSVAVIVEEDTDDSADETDDVLPTTANGSTYNIDIKSISSSLNDIYENLSNSAGQIAQRSLMEHITNMFNKKLLLDPKFILLTVSGMLTCFGGITIFTYIVDFATLSGIEHSQAVLMLPVIGVSNTLFRLIIGAVSDSPKVSPLHINNLGHIIGGISIALWPLLSSHTGFLVNSVMFGMTFAAYGSLRTVLTVRYLGLELLNDALGLQNMLKGIAMLLGAPFA